MVCCCEGDALSLFQHCKEVTCTLLIGLVCFRIESEAHAHLLTGNKVCDCPSHHVFRGGMDHVAAS